jgi:hypothetical protein
LLIIFQITTNVYCVAASWDKACICLAYVGLFKKFVGLIEFTSL